MLSTEHQQELEQIASELNLDMKALDAMRPWQAFITLTAQLVVNRGF